MHRRTRIAVAALVAVAVVVLIAPAASAAIRIVRINFDSPGRDTRSNASLNAEWIRLQNTGASARQLRGWRISDAAGRVYRFSRFTLRAGRTVTVHTGDWTDTAANLSGAAGTTSGTTTRTPPDSADRTVRSPRCSYDESAGSAVTC
jgi:Lamin Tail Domain